MGTGIGGIELTGDLCPGGGRCLTMREMGGGVNLLVWEGSGKDEGFGRRGYVSFRIGLLRKIFDLF